MTSSFTCRLFIRAPFEPESILLTDIQNPKLFSRATQNHAPNYIKKRTGGPTTSLLRENGCQHPSRRERSAT